MGMSFEIARLRKPAEGAMYVSDERLCVTADGEITGEDDPRAVRLLVAKGGSIPATEAAEYGLIADEQIQDESAPADAASGGDEEEPGPNRPAGRRKR